MTQIDDRLRTFRADQPDPSPDLVESAYARAVRQRRPPLWRRPVAVAPTVAAVAAAAVCGVLFWPAGEGPSPLQRAAAAVSAAGKIVHLRIEVQYENRLNGEWVSEDLVVGHWWTQFTGTTLSRIRLFISSGPLTEPPTDEDSSIVVADNGSVAMTSWVSGEIRRSADLPDGLTVEQIAPAGLFRKLLTDGSLEAVGETDVGIVLRGTDKACGTDYAFSEVIVDPDTYMPRRAVSGCVRDDEDFRQVWTFTDTETLADTPENRELLEIGDWPLGQPGAGPASVPDTAPAQAAESVPEPE